MKKKGKNLLADYLRACRKGAREEEIARHGHPVRIGGVRRSKKVYDRKKMKAGDRRLPDLFLERNENPVLHPFSAASCLFLRQAA